MLYVFKETRNLITIGIGNAKCKDLRDFRIWAAMQYLDVAIYKKQQWAAVE